MPNARTEMDARTLEALNGSIAKWEAIVAGEAGDRGQDNCPLCELFLLRGKMNCEGCPVFVAVNTQGCRNTPYEAWIEMYESEHDDAHSDGGDVPWFADTPVMVAAAQVELDFLRSLLPAHP